jgi:hypothetical protein
LSEEKYRLVKAICWVIITGSIGYMALQFPAIAEAVQNIANTLPVLRQ